MKKLFTRSTYSHQPGVIAVLMVLTLALSACQQSTLPETSASQAALTITVTLTGMPATAEPIIPTLTPIESIETPITVGYDPANPDSWKSLPVIPLTVSQRVRDLYEKGKTSGLNQAAFSKVGDCETSTPYFLAPFDMGKKGYRLGDYTSLAETISTYESSFERTSMAANSGWSVAAVLSPTWADSTQCKVDESPLVCEIRIHKPAIMLVMFGTNDVNTSSPAGFETYLKRLLDIAIANNVVPVIVTKADNLEIDHSMNAIIARVAYEYELPLFNLWRAMQILPNAGLMEDGIHLTYAQPFFDSPENLLMGWPVRNLMTLQMLEFLHTQLEP